MTTTEQTNQQQLPLFSTINVQHITAELSTLLQENLQQLEALLQQATFNWDNLMQPIEALDDRLHQYWSRVSHLNSVMNTPELRDAYNACLPKLSDYYTAISHNKKLYQAIQSIADNDAFAVLDQAQQQVIRNNLRDFKLAGVALSEAKKQQFAEITKQLTQLTAQFEQNLLDATKAWTKHITDKTELSGLPETILANCKEAAQEQKLDGWLLTLQQPIYIAVMTYADNRELRQEIYKAYVTRASDENAWNKPFNNDQIMVEILQLRQQLAQLLGFEHYAEESLATKMVKTTKQVFGFLNDLVDKSHTQGQQEFNQLKEFAQEYAKLTEIQAWDIAYFSEKLREKTYAINQEQLRAYFPEQQVIAGLFTVVQRLFGITIKPVNGADVWHADVNCYAIYNSNQQVVSYFYMDLYARTNKRGGAWMDDCCGRRQFTTGEIQLPIAFITCNLSRPHGGGEALFTHDEVITLFHEFGHALQHMLTKVDCLEVSGINGVAWDAVEVPSQFLENWAWQKVVMPDLTRHYKTGESLPDDLLENMQRAKNFQSAMQMLRQLEFALFDFTLHCQKQIQSADNIQQILNQVRKQVSVISTPSYNKFQNGFSHIFAGGYAAGYYSYKWAEVMACDAFAAFLETDIFDPATAQRFLQTFLQLGGSIEAADVFQEFRGREPQVDALLQQSGIA